MEEFESQKDEVMKEVRKLEKEFKELLDLGEHKPAAETAYALAFLLKEIGDKRWKEFAIESCRIYKILDREDVFPENWKIGSVLIPTYMHDLVVMKRFGLTNRDL